jgi:hypothetical protein
MFLVEKAARAQLQALACGRKLVEASPQAIGVTAQFGKAATAGGAEYAWQAMVRRLDRADQSYKN